jgi:hypothetical protein
MAFLSFKNKYDGRLLVVTYEGPGRLLLNGNRTHDERTRQNAAVHPEAVCWIELAPGGGRVAQGVGPAACRLESSEVDRLLRELPQTACCRAVLEHLEQGRSHVGRWLKLTRGQAAAEVRTEPVRGVSRGPDQRTPRADPTAPRA